MSSNRIVAAARFDKKGHIYVDMAFLLLEEAVGLKRPMRLQTADVTEVSPNVLERLRDNTRCMHKRVEQHVDLDIRCSTKVAYADLLAQMYRLHGAVEAALSHLDWTGTGIDLQRRRKTHLLRADLSYLEGRDVGPPAACAGGLELRTVTHGFGCLYVVEGSTLGGQQILRHVRRTLDLGPGNGASFFASYGSEVGSMWRAFGEAAKSHCTTELRIGEAVDAAIATFGIFNRELATHS